MIIIIILLLLTLFLPLHQVGGNAVKKELFILCPNNIGLRDLSDIEFYSCDIRIGLRSTSTKAKEVLKHILTKIPNAKPKIIYLEDKDIASGYGNMYDIYVDMLTHPDTYIKELTERLPSHILYINTINNGDYFITLSEKPFYDKYNYSKHLTDTLKIRRYYPYLTLLSKDIYIPTIQGF